MKKRTKKSRASEPDGQIQPRSTFVKPLGWTLDLAPGTRYELAKKIDRGTLTIENQGPGHVAVLGGGNTNPILVECGRVRVVQVVDSICLDSLDNCGACLEFEFTAA